MSRIFILLALALAGCNNTEPGRNLWGGIVNRWAKIGVGLGLDPVFFIGMCFFLFGVVTGILIYRRIAKARLTEELTKKIASLEREVEQAMKEGE